MLVNRKNVIGLLLLCSEYRRETNLRPWLDYLLGWLLDLMM